MVKWIRMKSNSEKLTQPLITKSASERSSLWAINTLMKGKLLLQAAVLLGTVIMTSCSDKLEQEDTKTTIAIQGSNTELELVRSLITGFHESNGVQASFNVTGGGSNEGIAHLIHGDIQVANASRLMSTDELQLAKEKGVSAVQAIIAMDAIAIITNADLGVDSLSIIELRSVLDGTITNWKEVGGPDLPITIYSRDKNSGTYSFMTGKFLGDKDFGKAIVKSKPEEIVEAVRNDKSAIGYVGIGSIMDGSGSPDGSIWTMNLYADGGKAISPFELRAVQSGEYPLSRPLLQYFSQKPKGALLALLKYELSQEGQERVRDAGYFQITDFHKGINKENGIFF